MTEADDAFERAAEKQAMVESWAISMPRIEPGRQRRHRDREGPPDGGGTDGEPPLGPWSNRPSRHGPWARGRNAAATWLVLWLTLLPVHWLASPEVDGWFIAHLVLISFAATAAFSAWQKGRAWRVQRSPQERL
jgi:hypothetical protein